MTIAEIVDCNENIWSFEDTVAPKSEMIPFSAQTKNIEEDKDKLRKEINERAKHQIIRVYLNEILSPNFYSTIVNKAANQKDLIRIDTDNTNDALIGGTVLLLPVKVLWRQIFSIFQNPQ